MTEKQRFSNLVMEQSNTNAIVVEWIGKVRDLEEKTEILGSHVKDLEKFIEWFIKETGYEIVLNDKERKAKIVPARK